MLSRVAAFLLCVLAAGPAEAQVSDAFARTPELGIGVIAETPQGLVAVGRPVQYVNASGEVEFHLFRVFENGRWRTEGNLGVGAYSGTIDTIAPYRDDWCVGGSFSSFSPGNFNFFACYSRQSETWYQPGGNGNGPNNVVSSIWYDGATYLYIGGAFTQVLDDQAAPITTNRVARTTGALWEPLTGDGGATNGVLSPVKVVRTFNGFVFVASGSSVFRYNPTNTTWTPFGTATFNNIPREVDDLVFFDNEVIASGPYDKVGGEDAPGIASSPVASGPNWLPLDDGSQGHGFGEPLMTANSSYVYVIGPWPDLANADGLARWTGFQWEAVDTTALGTSPTFSDVLSLPEQDICVLHSGLTNATLASAGVACKAEPGGAWRGTSQGMEGNVSAFARYAGSVYAGGAFLTAGDDALAARLARWDGARWSAVGGGVTGSVSSLATFQGELFAAGAITGAGGNPTGGLVAWNGSSWRDVGGPGTTASRLHAWGNALYFFGVAGNCSNILGSVCRYDGSTFEPVGTGLPEPVSIEAIADYQGRLVVAGNFRFAGGARQDVVAELVNGSWNVIISLNAGGGVMALASDDNFLYFGGQFTTNVVGAPGPLNGIGRWNGSVISTMGSGLAGGFFTRALAIDFYEGQVLVAGDFTTAGGITSRGIARWNGNAWSGLQGGLIDTPFPGTGSGTPVAGIGNALLGTSQGLFIGGTFDQLGNVFSANVGVFTGNLVINDGFEGQ